MARPQIGDRRAMSVGPRGSQNMKRTELGWALDIPTMSQPTPQPMPGPPQPGPGPAPALPDRHRPRDPRLLATPENRAKMQRQLRRSRKAAARRNRFSKIPWGTGPLTGQGLVNARAKWSGESPLAGLGGARAGVVHAGRDNRPWAAGPTRQPSAPGWGQRAPSTGGRR